MTGWRNNAGTTIDRSRRVNFTWAGRSYEGFGGDTLASALLANGVSIVGRSFKYHRPRGLIAAGLEEPNAIVQLEAGAATIPNMKATQVELYEGLVASPVNSWPSATFDILAVNSLVKRFIPAAFYYKTFLWPNWHLFEPRVKVRRVFERRIDFAAGFVAPRDEQAQIRLGVDLQRRVWRANHQNPE